MNKVKWLGFYLIQGSFKFVEEECVFVFGRQARVHNICTVNTSLHCMWLNIIKRKSKRLLGQKMIIHDFFLARHNYKTLFKKVIAFNHNNIIFQDEHFQIIPMIYEADCCVYCIIQSSICFLMLPSGKAFQLSHNNQPLSPTCYSKT